MRLIDADKLKQHYAWWNNEEQRTFDQIVDAQPTVETVVHGEWIEDGYNHYKAVCSECGEPCGTYVMNNPRDRFCKWCGAKMDGGADNG